MNYMYRRADVEDVVILVTTRPLRTRPFWDSDLKRAKKEILNFRQMGVQIVTVALGRNRQLISMQIQQMASYREPVVLSGFKKLITGDQKTEDVMKGVCPNINGNPGKFVLKNRNT